MNDGTKCELRMQSGPGNLEIIVAIDGKREPLRIVARAAYVLRQKEQGSKLMATTMQTSDRFPRPEREVEVWMNQAQVLLVVGE